MSTEEKSFQTYAEFWPYYLSQHSKLHTRLLHAAGTILGLAAVVYAFISFTPEWLLAAPVIGYGIPWIGHICIEKNHPTTFTYPGWSLRADFHMLWLMLTRRLSAEMTKHNLTGSVSA
ncbi:MAG: DUF962 domain-containing protein [Alphaproteobacteria bacterium]|nr:DUF962 domain-containing protein [Alphaproteobacteria bacterium]